MPFWTLWGGGAQKLEKQGIEKCAFREEENEPIGETIGREMAKEKRYKQNERQTLEAFINRFYYNTSSVPIKPSGESNVK